ncbi:TolC family protein [Echinicola sp. CAU 1574]|uniref:TolC family protein n=1 Tax=Echinicola arenosa TaxID=2774144 RepID=A0ABR9AK30_9BACT|nr:TolC family protein [Echinicola arenosa]MBD8489070.1 TolC family protein [Echinicola arenosa]
MNNKLVIHYILVFLMVVVPYLSNAQYALTDTLDYDVFIHKVIEHHPLSQKAKLNGLKAEATIRSARGNFDPVLESDFNQKLYSDKLYYRKSYSSLRFPTVAGFDLVAGYEKNSGTYLNSENQTGTDGLWNAGIELNVLQGLLMDEGRTALRQAKAYAAIAEQQRTLQTNDLYFSASEAYLYWANSHAALQIVQESIDLAENYFDNTKTSFFNGEKTAIDTVEAYIMWQDRKNLLQSVLSSYTSTQKNLENYLWNEDGWYAIEQKVPTDLGNIVENDNSIVFSLDTIEAHPILQEAQFKLSALEADRRMKREKLLPKLKLKYMPLLTPDGGEGLPGYNQNDYKWGFSFSFPLFLRGERGDLQLGKVKVQEQQLELENKTISLQNKILNSQQQINFLANQEAIQMENVEGYRKLLWAENEKFNFGESSVFLLNKRQEKYLEGQLKLVDLIMKRQLEQLKYRYYTNTLDIPNQ